MDWKFREDAVAQGSSDGFWYDITDGGYLKPELALSDKSQIQKVNEAIDLLVSFEKALTEADLIIEF